MAKSFSALREKMSAEAQAQAKARTEHLRKEMPLYELRLARNMTQKQMAEVLDQSQASVSQLEKRTDAYVSTLRSYIEAMGGRLEIKAVFQDGEVDINQFHQLSDNEVVI